MSDYNLLMSLPVRDLLDRVKLAVSGADHMLRALADRLDDDTDYIASLEMELEATKRDLKDASRRAMGWQEEAMQLNAQIKAMTK